MSKVVENGKLVKQARNKCKVCGLGNIEHDFDICEYCGWEADDLQNDDPNYSGGANNMSLNQYKQFWEKNKEDILKNLSKNRFYAIDKAKEYFKNNFKERYEEVKQRAEENRRKRELERLQEESKRKDNNSEN